MKIRTAVPADLDAVARVEAICFPAAEAAGLDAFRDRLRAYPNHFWVLEEGEEIVGFVGGMATDEETIRDEMYEKAALHREDGAWQAVFGLDVLPQLRRRGLAARLVETVLADARAAGRKGCILTCKEGLIPYYEKFGFVCGGISASLHGGAVWYDMTLRFPAADRN